MKPLRWSRGERRKRLVKLRELIAEAKGKIRPMTTVRNVLEGEETNLRKQPLSSVQRTALQPLGVMGGK